MMVSYASGRSPGSITLESQGDSRELVTYRGAGDLVGLLPDDPQLTFRTLVTDDGLRYVRRHPAMGMPLFRATASMLGLSIRARNEDWDRARWQRSLVAGHALDFVTRSKRILRTRFTSWRSFQLHPQLQFLTGLDDRLPLDFGMRSDGTDRITPSGLAKLGKQTALARGLAKPKPIEIVAYGLAAAAERRPLQIVDQEITELVRSVLFDESCLDAASCSARTAVVEEHLTYLLLRHLDEDRTRFTKWFAGGSSNLVKALMTRCLAQGMKLSRDEVVRSLLDLAWAGCLEMGANIEAFAHDFTAAMSAARIPFEADDFAGIHVRRAILGDLPLIMFMDVRGFLRSAVDDLLARPQDSQAVGVLHGVMKTYAEAARTSRMIERLKKRCGQGERELGDYDPEERNSAECAAPSEEVAELIDEILKHRRLNCRRCGTQLEGALIATPNGDDVRLRLKCRTHGKAGILKVAPLEFRLARRRIGS